MFIYLTDSLEATMSTTWKDATKYDTGYTPSVAMNDNGVVVEVHMEGGLRYRVGNQGQGNTIIWGDTVRYDSGVFPCVAINNLGYVVEVHMASTASSRLYCHVGKIDTERNLIQWGSSFKYDKGSIPKVAINDAGKVVTVHQTSNVFTNALYYHTGTIDEDKFKVKFNKAKKYDSGLLPSVALGKDGQVIEVHESQGFRSALWYHTGTLDGKKILFAPSEHYDSGEAPSVAINNKGQVVEVHKSQGYNTLYYHQGKLDGTTLKLEESVYYGDGRNPSAATAYTNSPQFVEVNEYHGNALVYRISATQ